MLSDKLKEWYYYKKLLPLYIQNSYGMNDNIQTYYQFLKDLDDLEDGICGSFGLLSIDIKKCKQGDPSELLKINKDVLDMIASMFGLSRYLSFTYQENGQPVFYDTVVDGGLNDIQFVRYLQIKILNELYRGSFKSLRDSYEKNTEAFNFNIPIYLTQGSNPATCTAYLIQTGDLDFDFDELEQKMFKGGVYTPVSMGISYSYQIVDSNIGIWDHTGNKGKWDIATWG